MLKEQWHQTKILWQKFENTSGPSVRDIVDSGKNHPSIIQIKQVSNRSGVSDNEGFSFQTVVEIEIKDLLKNLERVTWI